MSEAGEAGKRGGKRGPAERGRGGAVHAPMGRSSRRGAFRPDRTHWVAGAAALVAGLAAGAAAVHRLHARGPAAAQGAGPGAGLVEPTPKPGPDDYEAKEPGRGRLAAHPTAIPHRGWMDIAWRVGAAYFGDRVGFVAGGVTFFVTLSLFPTLATFVTLYGLFADPVKAWEHLGLLYSVLPSGVATFIGQEMQRLAATGQTTLTITLIWTLALSLWSANGAVKTLFYGLNIAYHETEKRNIVRYNWTCMVFTLSGLGFVLAIAGIVVVVPVVVNTFGFAIEGAALAPLRWPVLLAAYVAALTLVYRYGPCRQRARWRWLTPGALLAATASVAVSFVFSWYLTEVVKIERSYGPLGAVMGFLLWTWFSVQIVLLGAELNAEIERQTAVDTTTGAPLPLGERGALVADTIGPRRGSSAAVAFTLKHAEELSRRLKLRRVAKPAADIEVGPDKPPGQSQGESRD
ncbi:MAG TPA: YihY/virulence factor BrkB family protein [Caulobacteraceae bacterium]